MGEMNPTEKLTRSECLQLYRGVLADNDKDTMRELCASDLFFLLLVALRRKDINRQWLFERVREVQRNPNGMLDLWAREHYKSTIITFALTIQDILGDPELTFGLFSCTRPIAKGFGGQIKIELEDNEFLKMLFPDVLYENPRRDSPSWSLDGGLVVKRKTNPKECTLECSGIIDGMSTSKHYDVLLYDDVITERHVTSPEMIEKVNQAWALSLNLGSEGGEVRYVGTRYHFNDTYRLIMERGAAAPRIYPATEDGTVNGEPVLWSREYIAEKRQHLGPYVFGCQMLMNPVADAAQGFREDWLRYHDQPDKQAPAGWNLYLLCDPAGEKKRDNDYTVMMVIALAPDGNYYLIDGLRDRLNLTERTDALLAFHRKYKPLAVGYEKYGKDSDIQHIQYVQNQQNYRFSITAVGGAMPKNDRIRRLVPPFNMGRFYFPRRCMFVDLEGKAHDMVRELIAYEFTAFPVAIHDDMMDCMSRIMDPDFPAVFPTTVTEARRQNATGKTINDYDPFARAS